LSIWSLLVEVAVVDMVVVAAQVVSVLVQDYR
jgi:hypothetical protein